MKGGERQKCMGEGVQVQRVKGGADWLRYMNQLDFTMSLLI